MTAAQIAARVRDKRGLRAFGLFVAGQTYDQIARRTRRLDGGGPVTRERARQMVWGGYLMVRRRCQRVYPKPWLIPSYLKHLRGRQIGKRVPGKTLFRGGVGP